MKADNELLISLPVLACQNMGHTMQNLSHNARALFAGLFWTHFMIKTYEKGLGLFWLVKGK